jgi:anti-anti-sigma factor
MHNLMLPPARRNSASNITESDMAAYCTKWLAPSSAVLSVFGEIDAANAGEFAEYIELHLPHLSELVLDLTGVEFFGAPAFSAMHTLSVHAADKGIDWKLVPGPAVTRLLRICDPDAALPTEDSVATALLLLDRDPSALLEVVAKAR